MGRPTVAMLQESSFFFGAPLRLGAGSLSLFSNLGLGSNLRRRQLMLTHHQRLEVLWRPAAAAGKICA